MDDNEVMDTMRQMDEALGQHGAAGPEGAAAAMPNPCEAYNKIRDLLPMLIKIAERIPVIGKRLAAALRLLQMIGDQFCPV